MSTLVDELLQDFEDSDNEAGEQLDAEELPDDDEGDALMGAGGDIEMDGNDLLSSDDEGDEDGDEEMGGTEKNVRAAETKARIDQQVSGIGDARSVAALIKSLDPVLEKIAHFQSQPPESLQANVGNVEDHPEYHLLTQSNSLSTSIDTEIIQLHKWVRDHYSVRYPELETLIEHPIDYVRAVAILGNGPMDSETMKKMPKLTENPLNLALEAVLDKPTLMSVTTSAITTKGREVPQDELDRIVRACQVVIKFDRAKKTLTEYVQSRMNIFAPNLTALIGSLTAAQLLNTAGGLTALSKAPACNLSAWGSKKAAGAGALATNVTVRHQGYLYDAPLVRGIPSDLKKQALRIVANKVVLAARVDRIHSTPDGSTGEQLKEECLTRLDKLQEKPNAKGGRALPVPDEKLSRKRGGRQARKAKEATAMTDLRKAQNRMAFGKEEKEVGYGTGDGTKGMGMIGASQDGRVRGLQIDQRTRARLSAKSKGWGGASSVNSGGAASSLRGFGQAAGGLDLRGKGLRSSGVGSTIGGGVGAGTASSLSFTPVQGLELVDPSVRAEIGRKRKAEEDRWFKGGTFTQVGGDNGGFKKPDLPPAKKVDTGATKGQ